MSRPRPSTAWPGPRAAVILAGLGEGSGEGLRDLPFEITELVLTPYLGREEAARLAR